MSADVGTGSVEGGACQQEGGAKQSDLPHPPGDRRLNIDLSGMKSEIIVNSADGDGEMDDGNETGSRSETGSHSGSDSEKLPNGSSATEPCPSDLELLAKMEEANRWVNS